MSGDPKAMKLPPKRSEESLRWFITNLMQIIESLN